MILDYVEFKNQLKLYTRYQNQINKYTDLIQGIEYELSKIPSAFPETTLIDGKIVALPKTHGDPRQKEIYRLELIDLKESYEDTRKRYQNKILEIDMILNLLPEEFRKTIQRVYIEDEGFEKISKELGYSKAGLAYYIDNELQKIKFRTVQ